MVYLSHKPLQKGSYESFGLPNHDPLFSIVSDQESKLYLNLMVNIQYTSHYFVANKRYLRFSILPKNDLLNQ